MPDLSLRGYGLVAESVLISSGAALSSALKIGGRVPVGFFMPSAWTAAGLTVQVSRDGTTWFNLYVRESNTSVVEYTYTSPSASVFLPMDPNDFAGVNYLRLRSGTSGTPVNQGADRTLVVMLRNVR